MLASTVATTKNSTVAQTLLMRELTRLARSLHDMHQAVGDATRAREIRNLMTDRLRLVVDQMPTPAPGRAGADAAGSHPTCRRCRSESKLSVERSPARRCHARSRSAHRCPTTPSGATRTTAAANRRREARRTKEIPVADLDGDGVDDAFESTGRTAMMVAMQLGEKFARLREELARNAAARDDAAAKEMSARFDAERGAARAELRVIEQPEWWDRATPQDVARVLETAETWKGLDDTAARAAERIEHEVARSVRRRRERVPVRCDERAGAQRGGSHRGSAPPGGSGQAGPPAGGQGREGGTSEDSRSDLVRDLEDRAMEYERRADAGGDDTNTVEELRELATDARVKRSCIGIWTRRHRVHARRKRRLRRRRHTVPTLGVAYDSAERRRATAQQMESAGVPAEDVRVRSRVDAGQAQPAAEAVAHGAHAATRNVRGPQARGPPPYRSHR